MIPSFLAFINEAIQVTGMTSYFLHKSPFTNLITLVQHLFPDCVTCAWKCLKQPDKTVIIRCILLDSSGFSPRLPHLLLVGQMPHPSAPPDWRTSSVLLSTDRSHYNLPAFGCALDHSGSLWHSAPTPRILASPEWKCQCDLLPCSRYPFLQLPCHAERKMGREPHHQDWAAC